MTRPLDLADELAALVNPLPQPGATHATKHLPQPAAFLLPPVTPSHHLTLTPHTLQTWTQRRQGWETTC